MALGRYTELNVNWVYDTLTDGGKDFTGWVVTNKPEVNAMLDDCILEVLDGKAADGSKPRRK